MISFCVDIVDIINLWLVPFQLLDFFYRYRLVIGFLICDFLLCRYQFMIGSLTTSGHDLLFCQYRIAIDPLSVFSFVISFCVDIDDIDSWSVPLQLLNMLNKNDCRYRLMIGFLIYNFFLCQYCRYRLMIGSVTTSGHVKQEWLLILFWIHISGCAHRIFIWYERQQCNVKRSFFTLMKLIF